MTSIPSYSLKQIWTVGFCVSEGSKNFFVIISLFRAFNFIYQFILAVVSYIDNEETNLPFAFCPFNSIYVISYSL